MMGEKLKVIWVDEETHKTIKKAASEEGVSMKEWLRELAKHITSEGRRLWVYVDEGMMSDLLDLSEAMNVDVDITLSNAWKLLKMSLNDDTISALIIKKKREEEKEKEVEDVSA